MQSVTIKSSARELCSPLTANRLLSSIRSDENIKTLFWPRLVKDRSINNGVKVNIKLSDENLEYLRALKKHIRQTFGLFVSYSMLICVLTKLFRGHKQKVVMSLNVKGYKETADNFLERLKGITAQIKQVLPDIIFLQEFRVGEKQLYQEPLLRELGCFYEPFFPRSYIEKDNCTNCICVALVGKHLASKTRMAKLKKETEGYKLRYNYLKINDYVFLNAWIPQTFSAQSVNIEHAEKMWKDILSTVDDYANKPQKFCLIGDLNSFVGGAFENNMMRLHYLLRDTKIGEDANRPTGLLNILDYAFVNKYALRRDLVTTSIFEPSVKGMDLSDHDALITTITEVLDDVQ